MRLNFSKIHFYIIIFAGLTLVGGASCSTSRKMTAFEVKPMSTNRIVRKVEKETPVYKNYESSRISISFNDNDNKNSFSGQFKIDYDQCIILTLRKLNIPVGRALITPDSIILVNYFERYYISEHVGSLQEIIGIDLNYNMLQALLTADISKLTENEIFDKDLVSAIDSNMYRIDSQFSSKVNKAITTGNQKRLNRYMQRLDESEFTSYTVWIDPQLFVIKKIKFSDIKNDEHITIQYDEYKMVGRSLFPQSIAVDYLTAIKSMALEIKVSRPTVNKEKDFSFDVPEKYDKFRLTHN